MKGEYNIVLAETRQAISNLFHVVKVDDAFPSYIDGLKANMSDCLMKLYPLSTKSKSKLEKWKDIRSGYDRFVECAESTWNVYASLKNAKAFQRIIKFDGEQMKIITEITTERCHLFLDELKDALAQLHESDPNNNENVEKIAKQSSYFHRAYLYLKTAEAEKKFRKTLSLGEWKELKRISQQYETLNNLFLAQSSYKPTPVLSPKYALQYNRYKDDFQKLNRCKVRGEYAPHKIILILALFDIAEKYQHSKEKFYNYIPISDDLQFYYLSEWIKNVKTKRFHPNIGNPLVHMCSEPFYELIPLNGSDVSKCRSFKQIQRCCIGIKLEESLIDVMFDSTARNRLKEHLLNILKRG